MTTVLDGFAMALANSVPGVSGGTIAFILGFYDQFVGALDDLVYQPQKRKAALLYLLQLGIGWIIGMVLAVLVLAGLFERNIYAVSSLFLGLIIFSLPLMVKAEQKTLKTGWKSSFFALIGAAVVVVITLLASLNSANIADLMNLTFGTGVYLLLASMLAISAMILPGISGSTLLLIFGLYLPLVASAKELLHFNLAALPAILLFIVGSLVGAALIIKLVKTALTKHRAATIYLILGLTAGSLYAIILGPTTLAEPLAPVAWDNFSWLWFILGGAIILGIELARKRLAARATSAPA